MTAVAPPDPTLPPHPNAVAEAEAELEEQQLAGVNHCLQARHVRLLASNGCGHHPAAGHG